MSTSRIPPEVDYLKLAKEQADLTGLIPISELERFVGLLAGKKGEVEVELAFRIGKGRRPDEPPGVEIQGRLKAEVNLECQYCLAIYHHKLESDLLIRVQPEPREERRIELEQDLQALDDTVFCPVGEKLAINDMIEDELILGLPMIPGHEACTSISMRDGNDGNDGNDDNQAKSSRNMPFANLKQILKTKNRS